MAGKASADRRDGQAGRAGRQAGVLESRRAEQGREVGRADGEEVAVEWQAGGGDVGWKISIR